MTKKPAQAVKCSPEKRQSEQKTPLPDAASTDEAARAGASQKSDTAHDGTGERRQATADTSGQNTATPPEQAVPAVSSPWLTEQTVTRIIAITALVLACGSLVYIANIERQGGLLMTSARAMMSKAGIVEDGSSRSAPDKATLLSSIQYLSSAARGSEPFSTELAVAYKMVGEHPEIGKVLDSMLTGAEAGVPSVEDVSAAYAATLSKVYGYGPGQLLGQAASSISSIVGITTSTRRRQAVIEEVTVSVASGRLAQALMALEKLDEQSRAPFIAWRTQAQKRVALDAAVAEIKRIAFLSILDGAS